MLRQDEQIVAVKNCFGTEYIIQTKNRKNIQSIQIIVSKGRRRTHLDTALAEEYVLYVKHTLYKKSKKDIRYMRMDVPSKYLNTIATSKSPKSRWIIANIFKLMYSFLYLMGYTIEGMTYEQAMSLVDFLKNSSRYVISGDDLARENNTVALYLSHIRTYIRWLGHRDEHPMLRTNLVRYTDSYGNRQIAEKNTIGIRHYSEDTIRYHIKPDEYMRIREAKCIESKHYRLLVKSIIDLMFLHGLRIGEVLGLTLEDVCVEPDGMTCISIRNRFTKDKFRLAKGCINVASPMNYMDKEYQAEDVGFQTVYLEREAAKNLAAYISATHDFLPPRKRTRMAAFRHRQKTYKETTVADTVADYIKSDFIRKKMKLAPLEQRSIDRKNHYLFLNSRFKPLTDTLWNNILRRVMTDEQVGVDFGRKKFGLNHRFRHGFAIFLLREKKLDGYEVMKLMRHHSIESIEPYVKLTTEDVLELRNEHTKETFDLISECIKNNN